MEPPKKRKYPADDTVAGECDNSMDDLYIGDQLDVVSGSGGMAVAAKRNRRSYSLEFKVSVLDGYYHDPQTRLNQRKTAIKYGVNRRQIQKWLAQEETLRGSVGVAMPSHTDTAASPPGHKTTLSTYLNYQSKINYLRRMEGPAEKVTMVEVTPEFEQEEDFVIDERGNYESLPINLSKGDSTTQAMKDDRIVPIIKMEPTQTLQAITSVTTDISSVSPVTSGVPDSNLTPVLCHSYHMDKPINRETTRYGETPIHQNTNMHRDTAIYRNAQDNSMLSDTPNTNIHMNTQDNPMHRSTKMVHQDRSLNQDPLQPKLNVTSHAEDNRVHTLEMSSTQGPVSAHILDTSAGVQGRGVKVALYREAEEDTWIKLNQRVTGKEGRATDLIKWEQFLPGIYKIKFFTGDYFKSTHRESYYPYAEVVFDVKDPSQTHHIPLILTPYGYSTYKA